MKKSEDILCDYIPIRSSAALSDVAKDLSELVEQGLLVQVKGTHQLKELLVFPLDLSDGPDVDMEFRTVPGNTKYTLACETDRGLGGEFRRSEENSKAA
jgi:hypothetical protein